jgi:gamma-glutamyl phosphate reductase
MMLAGIFLMSLNCLDAQEVIKYNNKSITIQGPKCFMMDINGTILEYHQKIVGDDLYATVLTKSAAGAIREFTVRKVSVKVIMDNAFKIEHFDKYGEMYTCNILTDLDKVEASVYEKAGSKIFHETNVAVYFADKKQLTGFIAEIKKQRGF